MVTDYVKSGSEKVCIDIASELTAKREKRFSLEGERRGLGKGEGGGRLTCMGMIPSQENW